MDQVVDTLIECIVAFRARYGYARKIDDPELHKLLVNILHEHNLSQAALKQRGRIEFDGSIYLIVEPQS